VHTTYRQSVECLKTTVHQAQTELDCQKNRERRSPAVVSSGVLLIDLWVSRLGDGANTEASVSHECECVRDFPLSKDFTGIATAV
jgi:hypothetical protein